MHAQTLPEPAGDEISLQQIAEILWPRRWLIVLITALVTASAVAAAFLLRKQYEASIVVLPASDTSNSQLSGLGSIASQFGGLASLAGLSIGDSARKTESVAVLQSEALTEMYVQQNNLLPVLFKSRWISQTRTWNTTDPKKIPTLWKANQKFKHGIRDVTTNAKNGLVTLTIEWEDPVLAAKWANDLVRLTNEYLRDKAIRESDRNIAYLNDEASKTTLVQARQAIFAIMQSEINKEMLARGADEYALRVVDPAVAPERPSFPNKVLFLLGGGFVGFVGSAGWIVIRDRRRAGAAD
jgi:uncharacterized protein involved in exopolysaccharide biosynthesis